MPLFIIERQFADQLDLTDDAVQSIEEINDDVGVRWLFSFLSTDKKKTYCLYEAPSAEYIRAAARRNDIPADKIVEVDSIIEGVGGRLDVDPGTLVGVNVSTG